MLTILFFAGLALMMWFMAAMDKRFGDFMGMVFVLGMIGFAIVAVVCVAGAFVLPILFTIAVPIFLIWFVLWILTGIFKSPEQILAEKNANRVNIRAQELLTWRTEAKRATKQSQAAIITQPPLTKRAIITKRTHASYAKKPSQAARVQQQPPATRALTTKPILACSAKMRSQITRLTVFAIIVFLIAATIVHNFAYRQ